MSTSLLAFLSQLEEQVRPLLAEGRAWRFQRLIDLMGREAVLQLWEDFEEPTPAALSGQVNLREVTRGEDAAASFAGTMQTTVPGAGSRPFTFHPTDDAEVERQARQVAEQWARAMAESAQ